MGASASRSSGPRGWRRWRNRLLLVLASTLLALLCGELGLRLVGRAHPHPRRWVGEHQDAADATFAPDPRIGWTMPPGASKELVIDGRAVRYHADARGFRIDPGRTTPADASVIAFVGDSQVWGWGVAADETLGAAVSRALPGVVDANYGMPGFGLDQIWLTTRYVALPARPALVVVGVFEADFERSLHAWRPWERLTKPAFVLDDGALRPQRASDRPGPLLRFLDHHSHLWTLAKNARQRLGRRFDVGPWWRLNRAILDAIREDCAAHGVPVLFVRIPPRDGADFPMLTRYMAETGAAWVDPGSDHAFGPEVWQPNGHLDPTGHARVAESVVAWIRRSLPDLAGR